MNQSNVIPLFALHVAMNPAKYRLIAYTDTLENYNHEHDYANNPYWRAKSGSDYLVAELTLEQAMRGRDYLANAIACARPYIESDGPMIREWIASWELLAPGERTEREDQCLRYEGYIPDHPISVAELQRRAHVEKDAKTIYFPCVVDGLPATYEEAQASRAA